jgi:hypothetical protein
MVKIFFQFLKKNEKYCFYLAVLINIFPILCYRFFATLDGPAHLYNSQVIKTLWFDNSGIVNEFFKLNENLVPNWTGHFLLAILNFILPSYVSEKIFLIVYLVMLPIGFRALIAQQNKELVVFSYFIFPFTYSLLFCLGFYNFSIALALALVTLSVWISYLKKPNPFRSTLLMCFLLMACYFSHVFVFLIVIICICIYQLMHLMQQLKFEKVPKQQIIRHHLNKFFFLLLSGVPSFILCASFLFSRDSGGITVHLKMQELKDSLFELIPLTGFIHGGEKEYNILFRNLILATLFLGLSAQFRGFLNSENKIHYLTYKLINPKNTWLLMALLSMFMYFFLPDIDGGAGYVSVRILLISLLFFTIWTVLTNPPGWTIWIVIPIIIYCRVNSSSFHTKVLDESSKVANEFYSVGKLIPTNNSLLSIHATQSWMYGHFPNYLGVDHAIALLDNYECDISYFPVSWNLEQIPNNYFGNIKSGETNCVIWKSNELNKKRKIDYVFVNGALDNLVDTCKSKLLFNLQENYQSIYKSNNCELFKLKIKNGING